MNGPNNKIGWCDFTANPVRGKCLYNCPNCYAETIRKRFKRPEEIIFNPNWFDIKQIDSFWGKYDRPPKIFVGSMHDILGDWIPTAQIKDIIEQCRNWQIKEYDDNCIFQFLTQNPKRYAEFTWPDNCQLGTTIRTQPEADERIPLLLQIPAAHRFVCIEPMLGEIKITPPRFGYTIITGKFRTYQGKRQIAYGYNPKSPKIDQIILGCETGTRPRLPKIEWMIDVANQCEAAGVPLWVKAVPIDGKPCHDITKFPKPLQKREFV